MLYMTAGESHGPEELAIIEGIPLGLNVTTDMINHELARRQHAYGRGQRQVIETDTVTILSGVRHQVTLGSPITLNVHNDDHNHWRKIMDPNTPADAENSMRKVMRPRPGHADLVGGIKYRHQSDLRNVLERSSARNVGPAFSDLERLTTFQNLAELRAVTESFPTRALDEKGDQAMQDVIDRTKRDANTVGGTVQVMATGMPVGLGSYVAATEKLDAKIARAIISINAFKGVDFGGGFENAEKFGDQVMDEIFWDADQGFTRGSNNLGGFEGGMTTGGVIVVRGVVKPIPTLYRPMQSVDIDTHENHRASIERSDTTAVTAAVVIAEAMVRVPRRGAVILSTPTNVPVMFGCKRTFRILK